MLLELVTQPHCCKYFGNKICLNSIFDLIKSIQTSTGHKWISVEDHPYVVYSPRTKNSMLWITYIAIYLYDVGGNPTPCDEFGVMLLTELNISRLYKR